MNSFRDIVAHALKVADQNNLGEIEVSCGEETFKASLETRRKTHAKHPATTDAPKVDTQPVKATQVGFYSAEPHGLKLGQKVAVGDPIATITALGIQNFVESKFSGEIVEVLVSEGQPVEYGQILAQVKEG